MHDFTFICRPGDFALQSDTPELPPCLYAEPEDVIQSRPPLYADPEDVIQSRPPPYADPEDVIQSHNIDRHAMVNRSKRKERQSEEDISPYEVERVYSDNIIIVSISVHYQFSSQCNLPPQGSVSPVKTKNKKTLGT